MKFYVPELAVATLLPAQQAFQSKFGGKPWGFPIRHWPHCAECGTPMALLAQLAHAPPALRLAADGDVLHLFQCPQGGCSSYDFRAGCTAGLIVKQAELTQGLTQAPAACEDTQEIRLNVELWITGWTEQEDGIAENLTAAFFDWDQFDDLPEDFQSFGFDASRRTKSGSVPLWGGNGVAEHPAAPFEFLMQINTSLVVRGAMPAADAIGCHTRINQADGGSRDLPVSDHARRETAPWFAQQDEGEDVFHVEFANFGSDGTAYVFINRSTSPPGIAWSWSR